MQGEFSGLLGKASIKPQLMCGLLLHSKTHNKETTESSIQPRVNSDCTGIFIKSDICKKSCASNINAACHPLLSV